ncbi:hypothetical protein BpHYR1_033152 [Brachionus plicatilis]|uniref:Uncharacterized protein n=1 Tax=Brachionus plicatilis TaxID=10195 RepID=A0A3M7QL29_BRAPC|nr:hypothetical protein BpHYR1_033152 [Brachionus plicatilis]
MYFLLFSFFFSILFKDLSANLNRMIFNFKIWVKSLQTINSLKEKLSIPVSLWDLKSEKSKTHELKIKFYINELSFERKI